MQGDKLEIQRIPGKVNLDDYLPRQSVSTAVEQKDQFGMVNKEILKQMRIQNDASDEQIE